MHQQLNGGYGMIPNSQTNFNQSRIGNSNTMFANQGTQYCHPKYMNNTPVDYQSPNFQTNIQSLAQAAGKMGILI